MHDTRELLKHKFIQSAHWLKHLAILLPLLSLLQVAEAESTDLGNGFTDHGVAVPISGHRGMVATVDGEGRNVLLIWLMDHRGGYELLMLDAETGKADEFPIPFQNEKADSPYASILSSRNKFYTHFGDYFVEFDPVQRAYTFVSKTTPQMGMGMTEDDNGVIWSVSYPQSGVVAFNPQTREFRDYGEVYTQNWPQYQRYVAADDTGWIYFALGETASQIMAFDPATSSAKPMLSEAERVKGSAYLYRDMDGKVYGTARRGSDDEWSEFYKGKRKKIGSHKKRNKPIITGNQALTHLTFPDGTVVKSCNVVERILVVEDSRTSTVKELPFDYTSEGAIVMSLALAPDNTICGGTAFPMRFFSYNPETDQLLNRPGYDQWNTVARQGDRFFIGGYGGGVLMEWDLSKPWVDTDPNNPESNPAYHTKVTPVIHRPMELLALDDGKTVIMGGTPQYGHTGGGLLFWDREAKSELLLKDTDVIPDQSTKSMVPLPGGKLLGGTTTDAGTGGEKKAAEAKLYIMDLDSKKIEWHEAALPGVQDYTDMRLAPGGLVYGFADRKIFFVWDPASRKVIHQQDLEPTIGLTGWHQGPRLLVSGPDDQIYGLFLKGIAQIDNKTYTVKLIAESPIPAQTGGDYYNGRIYFAHGSHLYSYKLPDVSPSAPSGSTETTSP